ncbi:hypothetical protein ACET3Z_031901 [Daucus carota]
MATYHSKKKNPLRRKASECSKFDTDCKAYGTLDKGARKITDYSYILMPVATDGHWILFLWSVKDYRVTLFDSLRDDAPLMSLREVYAKEYYDVEKLMPIIFRRLDPENYPEESIIFPEVEQVKIRPSKEMALIVVFLL